MGGYAKQLSLGHAAYFGLGYYTSTILLIRVRSCHPGIGMLAGGIVAMLASLPIGYPLLSPPRSVFRDLHHRDGAGPDVTVPEISRFRLGR